MSNLTVCVLQQLGSLFELVFNEVLWAKANIDEIILWYGNVYLAAGLLFDSRLITVLWACVLLVRFVQLEKRKRTSCQHCLKCINYKQIEGRLLLWRYLSISQEPAQSLDHDETKLESRPAGHPLQKPESAFLSQQKSKYGLAHGL